MLATVQDTTGEVVTTYHYMLIPVLCLQCRTEEFCPLNGTCVYSTTHPPFDYIHYQSLTGDEMEFTVSVKYHL